MNDDQIFSGDTGEEVVNLISKEKLNILFFGFIRLSKGIDIVIDISGKLAISDFKNRINLIIAGNDPDRITDSLLKGKDEFCRRKISMLCRYIPDSEMRFLFQNSDFVILPYREISQSGVLEMAVLFRKPVITSPIEYFRDYLENFKSFGICVKDFKPESFVDALMKLADNVSEIPSFYSEEDLRKFEDYKNPDLFLSQLSLIIPFDK
jgi:glycosyltransferase involved in cell wall biosynthesis